MPPLARLMRRFGYYGTQLLTAPGSSPGVGFPQPRGIEHLFEPLSRDEVGLSGCRPSARLGAEMHARMFAFEGSSEEIEAAVALAREEILPLERRMPGFRGLILLSDKQARRLISLSLWENEELMLQSEESAKAITRAAAQSIGGKRLTIEPFDVAVFEFAT